ncbi:hypothetical protein CYMTET_48166 [Cymbomonas tetramitiformis]|uniref:Uncharacterized protein n=1 Tax=Cymbomonas tetramitiformis TaxID=36881 RepID=A0AAE0BUE4_9CHLO|nr:hypothetical protein CYMTET_48166 [Cymbomonas tetramitiformis]
MVLSDNTLEQYLLEEREVMRRKGVKVYQASEFFPNHMAGKYGTHIPNDSRPKRVPLAECADVIHEENSSCLLYDVQRKRSSVKDGLAEIVCGKLTNPTPISEAELESHVRLCEEGARMFPRVKRGVVQHDFESEFNYLTGDRYDRFFNTRKLANETMREAHCPIENYWPNESFREKTDGSPNEVVRRWRNAANAQLYTLVSEPSEKVLCAHVEYEKSVLLDAGIPLSSGHGVGGQQYRLKDFEGAMHKDIDVRSLLTRIRIFDVGRSEGVVQYWHAPDHKFAMRLYHGDLLFFNSAFSHAAGACERLEEDCHRYYVGNFVTLKFLNACKKFHGDFELPNSNKRAANRNKNRRARKKVAKAAERAEQSDK